jgi:hypothetical protein
LYAFICIFSPFLGLRPSLASILLTENLPKPIRNTSSSLARAEVTHLVKESIMCIASSSLQGN